MCIYIYIYIYIHTYIVSPINHEELHPSDKALFKRKQWLLLKV